MWCGVCDDAECRAAYITQLRRQVMLSALCSLLPHTHTPTHSLPSIFFFFYVTHTHNKNLLPHSLTRERFLSHFFCFLCVVLCCCCCSSHNITKKKKKNRNRFDQTGLSARPGKEGGAQDNDHNHRWYDLTGKLFSLCSLCSLLSLSLSLCVWSLQRPLHHHYDDDDL